MEKVKACTPQTWVYPQDSIDNIEWLEGVYDKVGLLVFLCDTFINLSNGYRVDWEFAQLGPGSKLKTRNRIDNEARRSV